MQKLIKKPSVNVLYVLKFPRYYTTWRLYSVTQDGFYIFLTSAGKEVEKISAERFSFLCYKFLVDTVSFETLNITAPSKSERIKITIEKASAFRSKNYSSEELCELIDDIENIEF